MRQSEAKGAVKHFECVKALAEGKTIQTKVDGKWMDESNPCWYYDHEYRIKPEKKIVPYEYGNEFYEDWCTKGQFLKPKSNTDTDIRYAPVSIYPNGICLEGIRISWDLLLRSYVFEDGTPCGKEVTE